MVRTVKDLIEILSELPDECQVFLTKENEVIPAEIEIKALMEKGSPEPLGVILNTVLSEEMERLITNN